MFTYKINLTLTKCLHIYEWGCLTKAGGGGGSRKDPNSQTPDLDNFNAGELNHFATHVSFRIFFQKNFIVSPVFKKIEWIKSLPRRGLKTAKLWKIGGQCVELM